MKLSSYGLEMNTDIVSYRSLCDRLLLQSIDEYETAIKQAEKSLASMREILAVIPVAPTDMGVPKETLRQWLHESLDAHRQNAH